MMILRLEEFNQVAQSHKVRKSLKVFEPVPLCHTEFFLSPPASVLRKKFILNTHVPCFVLVPVRKGLS